MTPKGWPSGEGLGFRSLLLSKSQVQNLLGAINSCVGPAHTELCSDFKWAPR